MAPTRLRDGDLVSFEPQRDVFRLRIYSVTVGGCAHNNGIMHGRSRMTIDPRIPTMPGRSTSGFGRIGRHCLLQSRGTEMSGISLAHITGRALAQVKKSSLVRRHSKKYTSLAQAEWVRFTTVQSIHDTSFLVRYFALIFSRPFTTIIIFWNRRLAFRIVSFLHHSVFAIFLGPRSPRQIFQHPSCSRSADKETCRGMLRTPIITMVSAGVGRSILMETEGRAAPGRQLSSRGCRVPPSRLKWSCFSPVSVGMACTVWLKGFGPLPAFSGTNYLD